MELTGDNCKSLRPKIKKVSLPDVFTESVDAHIRKIDADVLVLSQAIDDDFERGLLLCAAGVCDKDGAPLFPDCDTSIVRRWPFEVTEYVADQICDFNNLRDGQAGKN